MERVNDTFLLIGRLLMAALFLTCGHSQGLAGYGGGLRPSTLPNWGYPIRRSSAVVAVAIEVLVPIALIIGLSRASPRCCSSHSSLSQPHWRTGSGNFPGGMTRARTEQLPQERRPHRRTVVLLRQRAGRLLLGRPWRRSRHGRAAVPAQWQAKKQCQTRGRGSDTKAQGAPRGIRCQTPEGLTPPAAATTCPSCPSPSRAVVELVSQRQAGAVYRRSRSCLTYSFTSKFSLSSSVNRYSSRRNQLLCSRVSTPAPTKYPLSVRSNE